MNSQDFRPAMQRHLIIGTGVAAISAAEAIRSVDERGSIDFVGADSHGYYSRPGLAYFLTGELDEKQLFPYRPEDYKQLMARFHRGTVTRILTAEKVLEMNTGARLAYDRLLIATGSSAIRLNVPGASLAGVYKLDHLEDARRLLARAKQVRSAVVTGGGITALELAEGLAARGVQVNFIIRNERYWPTVLDEIESRIVAERLRAENIRVHFQSDVAEILGKNGQVAGVRLTNGRQIPAGLVAYAIGIAPRSELAREAGLACERGILVNERMETSQPDVFAAGDVAQVYDPLADRHILDSLWTPAREQGQAAGWNMAGRPRAYLKSVPFNVTRLAGLTTTIIGAVGTGGQEDLIGIARGDSETWRQIPNAIIAQGGFDVNHLRLMVGENFILGAIVMGDQKLSAPLQAIIRDQVDITAIRAQLLAPQAAIADILARFWADTHQRQRFTPMQ